ncbi:MATE family efflux transporter [Isachenkonia alkalipeptolytica]|uniref:Probable multidrug resistance protein NorM n=1 Tax=Isachenkonia alkalipeptolytica TaxID=2565777 RepID=A0AA43XK84_9CLOT|nr:MATE family efflux transporter [Isachenkonia alkalipeptolytica]NBG88162.1 MATE family efflux transporter [Isachenkonia alkalipeptolytica]
MAKTEKNLKNTILNFFKETKIASIFLLAIPAIIENISQVMIGVVDVYFVGRLGTEAIAGVGVTNLTMNVYIAFFLALGIGTTAVVSRAIGGKNLKKAGHAVKQSVIMTGIIGGIFGILNLIFARRILLLLGAEEGVIAYAIPYFLAVAVPSVFLGLSMVLASALRGAGNTKSPMKIGIFANVVNAVLDYVLIFGIFNFGGLGILGAGLATTFSRILSVVLLVHTLNKEKGKIHVAFFEDWKLDLKMFKTLTKISIPAAVERLIMRSGQLIYGGMIIKIGTEAYAAHNIAGTIETFSYLPGMGFGVAAATLVGQNLGKEDKDEAQRAGLMSYLMATLFMVIIGGVFYIFAPFLAGLFSEDPAVIDQVVRVLRIIALFQPFLAITLVTTAALQGAGDTKFPMYSSLLGIWGVRVVGVYILSIRMDYGLAGVWTAYAIDITLRGIILMIRFLKGKWKDIEIE